MYRQASPLYFKFHVAYHLLQWTARDYVVSSFLVCIFATKVKVFMRLVRVLH